MPLYSSQIQKEQAKQISSVALALEALELLLVEKGIIADNELMKRLSGLIEAKAMDADLKIQAKSKLRAG